MKRYGMVIKVKPDKLEEYKRLHANPWPGVIEALRECGRRNFSIYHKDGYLFAYFEYDGDDFEADTKKLREKPIVKKWLSLTDPCQEPLRSCKDGQWWAFMEEVYHHD